MALWFDNAIECGISVNGPIIQDKALAFARLIVPDAHFTASVGWLANFKKRHNIFEVTKSGEAASTPPECLLEYRMNLQMKTANYNRTDIYNCDKTALYWDLMPSKTLAHGSLSGTKKSKNQVTVMLTCNASSNKLPPLFIHKFNTPRTLKGINKASLPIYYYWSKNAWMQTSIFQHWLRKLNAKFS